MARNKVYDTARWLRLRRMKLAATPCCELCTKHGQTFEASVVDHIIPMSQGGAPYPALTDLRSLCVPHHNAKTRAEQLGKPFIDEPVVNMEDRGCDAAGNPLDRSHLWWSAK